MTGWIRDLGAREIDTQGGSFVRRGGLHENVGHIHFEPEISASQRLVHFSLDDDFDFGQYGEISAYLRCTSRDETLRLRWLALDAESRTIWQRRFEVRPNQPWQQVVLPLWQWRWGDEALADWSQVRSLALRVEGRADAVDIDDVLLSPGSPAASEMPTSRWLLEMAFEGRNHRWTLVEGVLVATDATAQLPAAELDRLARRVGVVRSFLVETFGAAAAQPVNADAPVPLLIYHHRRHYLALFDRLGEHWRVEIVPPDSAGYTVQDIAASTWSRTYGVDRPVFLHEATHALAARYLRLLNGVAAHSWLQEGLANYIQLCTSPESLDRRTYAQNFAKPIAADGSGFFKPLASLLGEQVEPANYAQLASLVAFLVEEHPDWLEAMAMAMAAGASVEAGLVECETDLPTLEKLWMAWGARTFSPEALAARQGHFTLPKSLDPLAPAPRQEPLAVSAQNRPAQN
jgi:hypothetical protein